MKKIVRKIWLVSLCVGYFTGTKVLAAPTDELSVNGTIQFQATDWPTPPTDPETPGKEVEPGGEIVKTEGPLRLDFVPQLNFGRQLISTKDQLYFANAQLFHDGTPARANYLQVTDNRGTLAGWQLSVRQERQFTSEQKADATLTGAVLSFDNQWANSTMASDYHPTIVKDAIQIREIGTSYPIAVADNGKGMGTWTISFGASAKEEQQPLTLTPLLDKQGEPVLDSTMNNQPIYKNQAVSLFIPGKTEKVIGKYTTVLTWIISELT